MSYFNHAFKKTFLGTKGDQAGDGDHKALEGGLLTDAGIDSVALSKTTSPYSLGVGSYGLFDPKTNKSLAPADVFNTECCPFYIAAASIKPNDLQGPYHGGYLESNKSKIINPKYISKLYKVEECAPSPAIIHMGVTAGTVLASGAATSGTAGTNLEDDTPATFTTDGIEVGDIVQNVTDGTQTTVVAIVDAENITTADAIFADTNDYRIIPAECDKEYLCGESYVLHVEIRGSAALRFANHNLYRDLEAYTGCCPDPTSPTPVDSGLVYINWATQIAQDPYLKDFVNPTVTDMNGVIWYKDAAAAVAAGAADTQIFANYVDLGANDLAGLTLTGAYEDTVFGDCSFQPTDFYQKAPLKLYLGLVDMVGDPCLFDTPCVVIECEGKQGEGFGESVIRDLILSESYLQNFFATEVRIREITQGTSVFTIDRTARYTKYYIQHSVPRFNNPSGVFDNDQYLLEIVMTGTVTAIETALTELATCIGCIEFDKYDCKDCQGD